MTTTVTRFHLTIGWKMTPQSSDRQQQCGRLRPRSWQCQVRSLYWAPGLASTLGLAWPIERKSSTSEGDLGKAVRARHRTKYAGVTWDWGSAAYLTALGRLDGLHYNSLLLCPSLGLCAFVYSVFHCHLYHISGRMHTGRQGETGPRWSVHRPNVYCTFKNKMSCTICSIRQPCSDPPSSRSIVRVMR